MTKKTNSTSIEVGKKSRLPRLKRAEQDNRPPLRITERDELIMENIKKYSALSTDHIMSLLFTPSTSTKCDERLRKLFHHGFLLRTEQPQSLMEGSKPLVYWLDKKGAEWLAIKQGVELSDINWKPNRHKVGAQFLHHLLDTNTVRIAICKAAGLLGLSIVEWKDEETLRSESKIDTVKIIPDDYFLIEQLIPEENASRFFRLFIEIDRRTVTGEAKTSNISQRDWAHKIQGYLEFFRSDIYVKRYGSTAGRVLTITTGEKRAQHLREITEKNGGKAKFWFTTFAQVSHETIFTAPIWTVASWKGGYSLTDTRRREHE